MNEEQRVCAAVYKPAGAANRFAVLERTKNWEGWELIKGHIEDEDPKDALREELREEAGITEIESIQPLDFEMEWTYERDGEQYHTTCICFLVEVPQDALIDTTGNPHEEHARGHFLNYRDAHDILHHENQQELLEHAHKILGGKTQPR